MAPTIWRRATVREFWLLRRRRAVGITLEVEPRVIDRDIGLSCWSVNSCSSWYESMTFPALIAWYSSRSAHGFFFRSPLSSAYFSWKFSCEAASGGSVKSD